MAKAAATLLVLLSCLWPTVQAEPHTLSVSFTVKTRSIRIMELTQYSVDGVPFHSDDKNDTRKEGNAPKECADLFPKLTDIEEEFRSQLHTMEQEGDLTTGSTSRTPDIGIVTSPSQLPSTMNTSQLLSTEQPPSKGGSSVTEGGTPIVIIILRIILAVIISISICIAICICIYKCVKRKSCTQGRKMGYKLCSLDSCIFGNCRDQHTPSAVGEPCPEETICMTVMSPLEGDSPHRSSASSS
ncbi:hypothetical protein ACRRTK_001462 [Alexandromys fortis]